MSRFRPSFTTIATLLGIAAVAALPPLVHRFHPASDYVLFPLAIIGIYTILVVGMNLLMGYAGQVSLGHAAFFGIGAYTSACLTTGVHHTNPWVAILFGMGIAGVVAFIVGLPCLRLHGHYLAVATLGIGVIANIIMKEWSEVTGGTSGIESIPKLTVLANPIDSNTEYFYLCWTVAIIALLFAGNIVNSRVGRALRALHTSESAAATLGVNIASYKLQVFVLSAIFAALAGSLYAHIVFFISPPTFGFMKSVEFVVMVVIGGMASIWGAVIGAGTMTMLGEWLRDLATNADKYGDKFAQIDIIVHGLILMLVMIFLPNGIFCTIRDAIYRWWRGRTKATRTAAAEPAKEVAVP